jgi:hypothetical protein
MSHEVEIDRLLTGINVGIVVGSSVNLLPNGVFLPKSYFVI